MIIKTRYIAIRDNMLAFTDFSRIDLLTFALIDGYTLSKGVYCGNAVEIANRINAEQELVRDSLKYLLDNYYIAPVDADGHNIGYKSIIIHD